MVREFQNNKRYETNFAHTQHTHSSLYCSTTAVRPSINAQIKTSTEVAALSLCTNTAHKSLHGPLPATPCSLLTSSILMEPLPNPFLVVVAFLFPNSALTATAPFGCLSINSDPSPFREYTLSRICAAMVSVLLIENSQVSKELSKSTNFQI